MQPQSIWEQLTQEHGEVICLSDYTRLYADGTEVTGFEYPQINLPPTDNFGNLKARLRFLETKLAREVKAFDEYKSELNSLQYYHENNPAFCPAVSPLALESLAAGKVRVENLRKQVAKLNAELEETPEMENLRAREKRNADLIASTQQSRRQTRDQISAINI